MVEALRTRRIVCRMPRDVAAVGLEQVDVVVAGLAGEQLARDADVALAQVEQPVVQSAEPCSARRDQVEQRVGDAAAGGQHDGLARRRVVFDDARDALHARGVGDARAAELVDFPGLHAADSLDGDFRCSETSKLYLLASRQAN